MRKLVTLCACLLFSIGLFSQDFSNKGKDFWISYAAHIDATISAMGIYITSNVNATGTVTVGTTAIPYTVAAGTVVRLFLGSSGTVNASNGAVYLSTQDGISIGAGIHVTANKPVAVYAHIINQARSGATLVLPVNVWGKEYVAPSYQNTGGTASYGEINVMAADTNTLVEITPSVASRNGLHAAGVPYTITLVNPGDVYQVQFTGSADISGTKIRSISTGTSGCKPIGVYSATTWSGFDCTGASGGDNLYQQLFPVSAWGKNFLTAPFYSRNNDIVRVFVSDPTAIVMKTESGITSQLTGLSSNNFYQYKTGSPTKLVSDKPISVVHYITSQSCGVGSPKPDADPEMVVLNPLEQTINDITVFSAHKNFVPPNQSVVTACYLNIIIQTAAAASFKINGSAPAGVFNVIPGTSYSYLQENVTNITLSNPVQTLHADSAFSAIAYGFGNFESYGYNAGTNVKDLFQHVIIHNQYATVDFPATCVNTPFTFAITLPYLAQSLAWDFHGSFPNVTNNAPVPDSSYIIDNKTVYVYRLPTPYTYASVGTYPVTVTALNPTSDGCSGVNQIDYDLEVFDKPHANFVFVNSGCISDSVRFQDSTNGQGRPVIKWNWQFGDNTVDTTRPNPVHLYQASGTFNVKLSVITDVGCLADTTIPLIITPAPIAKFGASVPQCPGLPVVFTDSSTVAVGTLTQWFWDYGNGQRDTLTTNAPRTITYTTPGNYTVTLSVKASGGCKSLVFSKIITIHVNPAADFQLPVICLPAGTGQFTSTSTISDGTQNQFIYLWNFGDGGTATTANPVHQYTGIGPFNIKLTVTSNNGCKADTTKALTSIYAQPHALFTAPAEICPGDTASFTDQSTAAGSTINKWRWSFGDGAIDTVNQNPKHVYASAGVFTVKLSAQSATGCYSDTASKQITVNAAPIANFTIGTPACLAQGVSFASTSTSASGTIVRWVWNFGDGTTLDTTAGMVTHFYTSATNYSVSLTVISTKGCTSAAITKPVTIGATPVAAFGLPQVCLNDPFAEFTDSSTIADGTSAAFQYQWNFGDPNATNLNPNTSNIKNARHRYTTSGIYTVSLTITSGSGCTASVTRQLTINGGAPVADFTIQNTGNACAADSVSIQNKSTVNFGSITKTEIFWDYTNNPAQKETDSFPAPNKLYHHLYSSTAIPSQQYTIRFLAYSGGVCVNSTQKILTVYANPVAKIGVSPAQVCLGTPLSFTDSSTNNGLNITGWNWSFGDNGSALVKTIAHSYPLAGTYTVRLQNKTADGCSSPITTRQVTVSPIPAVNAGLDLFVLEGGQAQLKATVSGSSNYRFSWTPATWLSDSSTLQPIVKPLTDITYRLTVTGNGGCSAYDDVLVKIQKGLIIPNAFSPNGDGVNDKWVIQFLESYPGNTIQVFDRFGRLVFNAASGVNITWDGTLNGKALPIGTYYYIIDPKNGRPLINGSVTILR